jgi:hypothetical protein
MVSFETFADMTAEYTLSRTIDAPTVEQAGLFTEYCYQVSVDTAQEIIGDDDFVTVAFNVEGTNWNYICGSQDIPELTPCTLSFWVKATVTGQYGVSQLQTGSESVYVTSITINIANTWEFKTISWGPLGSEAGNTKLIFCLACGVNRQVTVPQYTSIGYYGLPSQVNAIEDAGNSFKIQLVQCEAGPFATPFELKDFGEEFQACQRYCEKSYRPEDAPETDTNNNLSCVVTSQRAPAPAFALSNAGQVYFKVRKMAIPTLTLYSKIGTTGEWDWRASAFPSSFTLDDTRGFPSQNGFQVRQHIQTVQSFIGMGHFIAECNTF